MKIKHVVPSLLLTIFLAACNTTVIDDEARALPAEALSNPSSSAMAAYNGQSSSDDTETDASSSESISEDRTASADISQSFIAFIGAKGDIISHEGTFNDFAFDVTFEGGEPIAIDSVITITSLETDSNGLTKHLLSPDFFEVDTYTEASFTSSQIEPLGNDAYEITGEMTIKDVSNPVTVQAVITDQYLTSNFTLDRTDFSVGSPPGGAKSIDAEVPMEIKIVFE